MRTLETVLPLGRRVPLEAGSPASHCMTYGWQALETLAGARGRDYTPTKTAQHCSHQAECVRRQSKSQYSTRTAWGDSLYNQAFNKGGPVRIATALLICLMPTVSGLFTFAQSSTPAPTTVVSRAQQAIEPPRAPAFEYLGRLREEIGTRTLVENGPQGTRTIVQVVGGRFEGPGVKASVQMPAGDWISNRADGSYRLDARLTLKTDDGAVILMTYNGIAQTTDAGASVRAAPLFETGDSRYVWLTRLQAVGVGERVGTTVTYDIYALK